MDASGTLLGWTRPYSDELPVGFGPSAFSTNQLQVSFAHVEEACVVRWRGAGHHPLRLSGPPGAEGGAGLCEGRKQTLGKSSCFKSLLASRYSEASAGMLASLGLGRCGMPRLKGAFIRNLDWWLDVARLKGLSCSSTGTRG